jgi:hypothetical protein
MEEVIESFLRKEPAETKACFTDGNVLMCEGNHVAHWEGYKVYIDKRDTPYKKALYELIPSSGITFVQL